MGQPRMDPQYMDAQGHTSQEERHEYYQMTEYEDRSTATTIRDTADLDVVPRYPEPYFEAEASHAQLLLDLLL